MTNWLKKNVILLLGGLRIVKGRIINKLFLKLKQYNIKIVWIYGKDLNTKIMRGIKVI